MTEALYIDAEGITWFDDGTYSLIEGGERYSAPGIVAEEAMAGEAEGEAAPEEGREDQSGSGGEPEKSDVQMGEREEGLEEDGGSSEDYESKAKVDEGDVASDTGDHEVYEGVTTEQFAQYQTEVYARLDAINTICIVLVIAVFFASGIAAVDNLIRSTERF